MQNLPTPYIVGLVKQISRKTKKSYYQIYFSSRVRLQTKSKISFLKNAARYSPSTKSNAHMRGYLTIWDDRGRPCGANHPYFKECLDAHGLKFSDFVKDKDKKGLFRLPSPVMTEIYEFGGAEINRKTGQQVAYNFEIVPAEQEEDDQPELDLEALTVSKLKSMAADYSIEIPRDCKLKSDIISHLKDQLS